MQTTPKNEHSAGVVPIHRPTAQDKRIQELERALHDVYDGMMITLTTAAYAGSPDEIEIREAIRKARRSYTAAIRSGAAQPPNEGTGG